MDSTLELDQPDATVQPVRPARAPTSYGPEQISKWLRVNDFCRDFSETTIQTLAKRGYCSRIATRQIIFEQNDIGASMYLLFEGSVGLSAQRLESSEQRTIGVIAAGQFFGEMALLEKAPRSGRATTLTPSVLFEIETTAFNELLANESLALTRNLLLQANTNLRRTVDRMLSDVVDQERRQVFVSVVEWILDKKQDSLTGMKLNAEMLAGANLPGGMQNGALDLRDQVDELIRFFETMHEFCSGSSNPLKNRNIDLRSIWQAEEGPILDLLKRRQLHLDSYVETLRLMMDSDLLGKIFYHLFAGISPMAEPHSLVEWRAGLLGSALEIRIAYRHPGITEYQALRLFDPFVFDGAGGRTGIDLALVRLWAEKMGGKAVLQQKAGDKVTLAAIFPMQEVG